MKQLRRWISIILMLCITFSVMPITTYAATEVTSGTCGKNLTWVLTDDGTLTISGQGAMADYESSIGGPWNGFWFDYRGQINNVVIDEGVTTIGDCAFWGCENLTSIKIPDSMISIGSESFCHCVSLCNITIPDRVTTIDEWAFYGCSSLTSVSIPDSVTTIGRLAFHLCDNLSGIWVGDGNSFYYSDAAGVLFNKEKTKLIQAPGAISGSYSIVDGVTTINEYAFYSCDDLTGVTIADSVTTIGENAFSYCASMTNINVGDGIATIPNGLFDGCSNLSQLSIGSGVSEIIADAFFDCSSLTQIWVDDNNAYYSSDNSGVLYSKDKAQLIFVPNALNGEYFISERTNTIGEYALCNCNSLTRVVIPESVTSIGECAFKNCTALSEICVDEKNTCFSCDNFGVLFDKNKNQLISVPGAMTGEYLVPHSVTNISEYAFYNCVNLTKVSLPAGITSVPDYAFYSCEKLASVWMPQSVTKIGWWSFAYSGITSITIPKNVSFIDRSAFVRCYELSEIFFEGDAPYFRSVDYGTSAGEFVGVTATAYYPSDNPTWTSNVRRSYGGYINWVAYQPKEDDKETPSSISVRFFQFWDAQNQIAYFNSDPSENPTNLGSQVTEETDTSFLEKVDELIGTYVLAVTKIRDDGMIAPDTLISITPVETYTGTITEIGDSTISIDGVSYPVTERLYPLFFSVGDLVMYHVYDGEIVGISEYNSDVDKPVPPDVPEDEYHLVVYPYGNLSIEVGESLELTCSLYNGGAQVAGWEQPQLSISHKEDIAPLDYEGWEQRQAGGYTLNVKGVSPGIAYLTIYDAVSEDVVEITIEVISGRADSAMNLNVNYWDSLEKKEKTAQVKWGYKLFGEDARNIENADPESFAELVKISALLANSSYDLTDGGYLQHLLGQLGAENIEIEKSGNWDISNPAHSISHVEFYQGGIQKDVVIVTIRGSTTVGDWITDFVAWAGNSWDSPKEHEGFSMAKNKIKKEIKEYLSRNGIDASETKILIAGHSYGAAVANLLANSLEDVFAQGSIYAYTFASPNNIVVDPSSAPDYLSTDNIHNFRNVWDPVTRVPIAPALMEAYTIFGEQHFFTLEEIGDTSEGVDIFGNHNCTHYVNYALNLVEHNAVDSLQTRCVQIHCPVDVTAYDGNGNVVGQITNNQLNESSTNIMMFPMSDQKNIFVDQNEDVQLSIVATDPGTMDVIITEYDVVTGNVSAIKKYSGIGLIEGKDFYTSICDETVTADIVLEVVDNEGNRLAVVNEDGTETTDISEKHKHSTDIRNMKEATCTETGYSGDEVCSECGTVVKKGFEISTISHDYKDVVTNPTCTADGYTTHTCSVCGDTYTGDPVTKLGHDMSYPTCTEAAMCQREGCDYTEGSALGHNYEDDWTYGSEKHWHECSCGAKSDDAAHSGGTATCNDKAECSVCGTAYGEFAAHTYADGKCTVCKATDPNYKEPSDVPQTGDNSHIALWFALLLISGFSVITISIYGKKRTSAK